MRLCVPCIILINKNHRQFKRLAVWGELSSVLRKGGVSMDEIYAAFAAAHAGGRLTTYGRPGARFLLSIEPGWLFLLADGEPEAKDFTSIFADAKATGLIRGNLSILVDLSIFYGAVNWSTVNELHDAVDWTAIEKINVAYVALEKGFALLAKIASVIFRAATHRVFDNEKNAVAWLKSVRG
jgi:hypothetical protein